MHEVDLACPQINYIDNPNGREVYKGVMRGLRKHLSKVIAFPNGELSDREESAASEITFHLQRNNIEQIKHEIEDVVCFVHDFLEKYAENDTIREGDDDDEVWF